MRYPASEKLEIIRTVEQSHLSAKRTLDQLDALFDGPSQVSRHLHDARMRPHDATLSYCHGCQ